MAGEKIPSHESKDLTSVEFTCEDAKLHGHLFTPEKRAEKLPGVLFIHGWKGSQVGNLEYAKAAAEDGFAGFTFDLRGHGISEGDAQKLTPEDFLHDAIAAYDAFVADPNVDPEDVTVVGTSFGSFLAARLTEVRKVRSLILRAPADYPAEDLSKPVAELSGSSELKAWRSGSHTPEGSKTLADVQAFDGNILIIESEHDEVIPHQMVENFLAAAPKERTDHAVMAGTSHALKDPKDWAAYQAILLGWLKKTHPDFTPPTV